MTLSWQEQIKWLVSVILPATGQLKPVHKWFFHSLSVEVPFDMTEKSIKLSVALLMVRPR